MTITPPKRMMPPAARSVNLTRLAEFRGAGEKVPGRDGVLGFGGGGRFGIPA